MEMGFTGVPLIDMQEGEGLAEKLVKACEETGCFRVMNHGVPTTLMSDFKKLAADIFDLPREVKKQVSLSYDDFNPVYESAGVYDMTVPGALYECCNRLGLSAYQREIFVKYAEALYELAGRIGRKLMDGTGVDGDLFDGWTSTLRLNKFKYTPETLGSKGTIMHTDDGFITVLQDDEGANGLEMLDKHTGKLVPVDPIPGISTFVINMGDVAKAWSNKRFHNVKHHVICRHPKVRFSMGLFVLGPKDGKLVDAPPQLIDSDHLRCYLPFDFEEYSKLRVAAKTHNDEALKFFTVNNA